MNNYDTDVQIIDAIKTGDPEGIKQLYHLYYKMIADMILKNSGQLEDAEDIFQDTLIALVTAIRKDGFILSAKLSSLIYSISRNQWLYKLRGNKHGPFIPTDGFDPAAEVGQIEEKELFEERHSLIARLIDKISIECQKILKEFYFEEKALKDIGVQMNYTEGSIRVKKSRCMDSLKKLVEEDSDYQQNIKS